ncbi:hypothetical protein JW992_10040 [candidate division KSB1 bacterium]|nr:hypothetical protein [candidate division KSB1 bacterium]
METLAAVGSKFLLGVNIRTDAGLFNFFFTQELENSQTLKTRLFTPLSPFVVFVCC